MTLKKLRFRDLETIINALEKVLQQKVFSSWKIREIVLEKLRGWNYNWRLYIEGRTFVSCH